jgi:hypothetical protein
MLFQKRGNSKMNPGKTFSPDKVVGNDTISVG